MAKRTKRLTAQEDEKDEIRINKFLSEAGVCSRREADRYITEGKIKIDGVVAQMGSKVKKDSQVTFGDKPVKKEEKLVLIAYNKPEGIVCTTDKKDPDNIIDYINYGMRIYPVGRLDKDSEGLILLTNDGNIVNKILRAENIHEKEYVVTVNKEIDVEFIKAMSAGVPIMETVTNPCTVKQIDKYIFDIILTQGLNRQIRRMCEYLGYRVTNLKRIRIMNINLGRLKTGDFRNVTEKEIEELVQSFHNHKSIGEAGKNVTGYKADGHGETRRIETGNKVNSKIKAGKRTSSNKYVGNKYVSNKSISDKNISDKIISDKNLSDKIISDKNNSDKSISGRNISGKNIGGRNISGKNVSDKNVSDKNISGRNTSGRNISGRNINGKNISDKSINDKNIGDKNIRDKSISDKNVSNKNTSSKNISDKNISNKKNYSKSSYNKDNDNRGSNNRRSNSKDFIKR